MNAQVPVPDATTVPQECRFGSEALRACRWLFVFCSRSDRSIRAFIKGPGALTAVEFGLIFVPFMAMMLEILQNAFSSRCRVRSIRRLSLRRAVVATSNPTYAEY
jgi:hypothetical protein